MKHTGKSYSTVVVIILFPSSGKTTPIAYDRLPIVAFLCRFAINDNRQAFGGWRHLLDLC